MDEWLTLYERVAPSRAEFIVAVTARAWPVWADYAHPPDAFYSHLLACGCLVSGPLWLARWDAPDERER